MQILNIQTVSNWTLDRVDEFGQSDILSNIAIGYLASMAIGPSIPATAALYFGIAKTLEHYAFKRIEKPAQDFADIQKNKTLKLAIRVSIFCTNFFFKSTILCGAPMSYITASCFLAVVEIPFFDFQKINIFKK
jgi:hypothetical protein